MRSTLKLFFLLFALFIAVPGYNFGQSFDPKQVPLDTLIEWLRTRMQDPEIDSTTYRYAHAALNRAIEQKDTIAMGRSYHLLAEWQNIFLSCS